MDFLLTRLLHYSFKSNLRKTSVVFVKNIPKAWKSSATKVLIFKMMKNFLRSVSFMKAAAHQNARRQQLPRVSRRNLTNIKESKTTATDTAIVDGFFGVTVFLPGYLIYNDTKQCIAHGKKSNCSWSAILWCSVMIGIYSHFCVLALWVEIFLHDMGESMSTERKLNRKTKIINTTTSQQNSFYRHNLRNLLDLLILCFVIQFDFTVRSSILQQGKERTMAVTSTVVSYWK